MSEQEVQDSQKTVVAFIAGLLVGGLLVWVFSSDTPVEAPTHDHEGDKKTEVVDDDQSENTSTEGSEDVVAEDASATIEVGEASVSLDSIAAGNVVTFSAATYPTDEGWIAVRTYRDGQLGNILGASQYSKAAGLTPEAIRLLVPTVAGREYAVVFFSQDSNPSFNLDGDAQLDTELTTFIAE